MTTGRALKRPDGMLLEEYVTSSAHFVEDGEIVGHDNTPDGGYTGVFWFQYPDGTTTRRYTGRTAPQWLKALYLAATTSDGSVT